MRLTVKIRVEGGYVETITEFPGKRWSEIDERNNEITIVLVEPVRPFLPVPNDQVRERHRGGKAKASTTSTRQTHAKAKSRKARKR